MDSSSSTPDPNVSRLVDLAKEALHIQVRLVSIGLELGRATLAGDAGAQEAGREYVDAVSREAEEYWKSVRELGIDYAAELAALSGKMAGKALSEITAGRSGDDSGSDEGGPRTPFTNPSATSDDEGGPRTPFTNPSATAAPRTAKKATVTKAAPTKTTPKKTTAKSTTKKSTTKSTAASSGDEGGPRPFTNPSRARGSEDGPRTPFTNPSLQAKPRQIAAAMSGSVGDTTTVAVTVRNAATRRRKVTVTPGALTTRNGRPVRATLTVEPESVTLAPGAEATVVLSLVLDPAALKAGRRYRGSATVSGGEDAAVTVTIDVAH